MLQAGRRVWLLLLLSSGAVGGDPLLPLLLLLLLLLLVERVQMRVLLLLVVGRAMRVLPCLAAPVQLLQLAPLVHQQNALLQLAARPVLQECNRSGRGGGSENAG